MNKEINCLIVLGCPSNAEKAMDEKTRTYDKHWQPWLKKELIIRGIPTQTPLMPNPWAPVYDAFKNEFSKFSVTENTILIGHSCGCAFLVRWLGETRQTIYKLILVAPWKIPDRNSPIKKAFYRYHIDPTIKSRTKEIVMFTSNNEREAGKRSLTIYHQSLGGEIINLPNHGHYTMEGMSTPEFPELLTVVLR